MSVRMIAPTLVLALLTLSVEVNAGILYAISGDDFGIPRRVNQIDTSASTVTPLFDLGDGSLGFSGLAFANNQFYSVGSSGFGVGTLHTFSLADAGITTPLFDLGTGFNGGLAAQSGNQFYALANAPSGASSLYSIDLGATTVSLLDPALGFGLAGGLTWNSDDGLLYALGSDIFFQQSLYSIDPAAPGSAATVGAPLGSGIIGGLDYAGVDGMLAIGNQFGFSQLLDVTSGAGSTPLFPLAPFPSYTFSALTSGPAGTPVIPMSAPAVLWLLLPALWPLLRRSSGRARSTRHG